MSIVTVSDAAQALEAPWPLVVDEVRAVLGGELHYQAVVYHCLRTVGVPRDQIGMNVKQWIANPVTALFQRYDLRKHQDYRGGFEPIPDLVVFRPDIAADWRRRNQDATLRHMLSAIEIKASERAGKRLHANEIVSDIHKLAAHRDEVRARGSDMQPVMMVIDTAPLVAERMRPEALDLSLAAARELAVAFLYVSAERDQAVWSASLARRI